jgi:uncharacterized repeat protein (TIGR03803 family)
MNRLAKFSVVAIFLLAISLILPNAARAAVTEKVIFDFPKGNIQGYFPDTPLLYKSGRFYGTTNNGGGEQCNCGVVFSLAPKTGGGWNYDVLHAFQGTATDGYGPLGALVFDAAGNLYGATSEGGTDFDGTVYELSPSSSGWNYKVIYSFDGTDGSQAGGLTIDAAGNLYGITGGGANDAGLIYELSPGTGGSWSETVLYSFTGGADGFGPNCLAIDAAGNLYGTAFLGGANDFGTVFEVSPSPGGGWAENTLWTSTSAVGNLLTVMRDNSGNLYVTSYVNGPSNWGSVVELTNSAGGWSSTVLYSFSGSGKSQANTWPKGALVMNASGALYGTTQYGGEFGAGTVYKLTPTSGGTWVLNIINSFNDSGGGDSPIVGVTLVNGNLFGITIGGGLSPDGPVIYEITP